MRYLVLANFVFLLVACNFDHHNTISGNGKVVTKQVAVDHFNKLTVSNGLEAIIIPSVAQNVIIEADENILEGIKVEVEDSTLQISTDKRIWIARSKKVKVYCSQLVQIKATAGSKIISTDSLVTDQLKVDSHSGSDVSICGRFKHLVIEASSGSSIKIKGVTDNLEANLSSAADLHAFGLKSESASIKASSAAIARVFITREVHFDASSAAAITYRGNPVVKDIHVSSAGNVKSD
jgi:hypothetical protein